MSSTEPLPPAIPAATVVVIRNGEEGLETLMLRRNSKLAFGGMWVFPGGRIDVDDDQGDEVATARTAAVREAAEEADLVIDPSAVVPFAHWEPPPVMPKRFATWFFLAPVPPGIDGEVAIDGGEIHEHQWRRPADVLTSRDAGDVELAPPTWVTLHDLSQHGTIADALRWAGRLSEIPRYVTNWKQVADGAVAMWDGDAGYEAGDPSIAGGRHRLNMGATWRLERS